MNFRLFSSDLDGTLLGDPAATGRFNRWWEALEPSTKPVLAYNSGRHMDNLIELMGEGLLPEPDFLIGSVGTEAFDWKRGRRMHELREGFDPRWNIKAVDRVLSKLPRISRQPPEACNPFKSSWFLHGIPSRQVVEIRALLCSEGLKAQLIFSHGSDLDVLPHGTDKGSALAWLCGKTGVPLSSVIVAGDSGNDASMFEVRGVRGIMVGNAHDDLLQALSGRDVYRSTGRTADGVIEGLEHFAS